jgi:DNA-binding MarR family transcriptional regulator/GNAT superfamily N-acetyltransferase
MSSTRVLEEAVRAVRRFGRFYTGRLGVLQDHLLDTPFSLPEARILYELAQRDEATASRIGADLSLDSGYLSRLLRGLEERGLIRRRESPDDARKQMIMLTGPGRSAFTKLDRAADEQVRAMLEPLPEREKGRLVGAMRAIESLLGGDVPASPAYVLRPHRPGDMGWVVHRHGVLYSQEYRWNEAFEALVAGIVAEFIQKFDAKRERCWIAEVDGEPVGSVFLVKASEDVAKLRLLLVEPRARGMGIGRRLVEECVRFARQAGYERMTLWTNDVLTSARRIYQTAGFTLTKEEPHGLFGRGLVGQTWELELTAGPARHRSSGT